MLSMPARYRIRVQGRLGPEWSAWFGGLSLSWQEPDQTVLVGQVLHEGVGVADECAQLVAAVGP